jgi:sulfur relay (sulfurtransferase) DsrC/TusE family protein
MLAASHRLLQDTLVTAAWDEFAAAAMAGKAQMDQISDVIRHVVEEYTAWKYWPAMRLLGWTAAHLPERDGTALMNGRSLAGLSPRQACNLAFATLLAGHENPEDRDTFTEDLMFDGNPEADAMAAVREMQRAQQAQEEAAGGG